MILFQVYGYLLEVYLGIVRGQIKQRSKGNCSPLSEGLAETQTARKENQDR